MLCIFKCSFIFRVIVVQVTALLSELSLAYNIIYVQKHCQILYIKEWRNTKLKLSPFIYHMKCLSEIENEKHKLSCQESHSCIGNKISWLHLKMRCNVDRCQQFVNIYWHKHNEHTRPVPCTPWESGKQFSRGKGALYCVLA